MSSIRLLSRYLWICHLINNNITILDHFLDHLLKNSGFHNNKRCHLQVPKSVQLRKRLSPILVETQIVVGKVQPHQGVATVGQVLEGKLCQFIVLQKEPLKPRQTGKRSRSYFPDIVVTQRSANDLDIMDQWPHHQVQCHRERHLRIRTFASSAVDQRTSFPESPSSGSSSGHWNDNVGVHCGDHNVNSMVSVLHFLQDHIGKCIVLQHNPIVGYVNTHDGFVGIRNGVVLNNFGQSSQAQPLAEHCGQGMASACTPIQIKIWRWDKRCLKALFWQETLYHLLHFRFCFGNASNLL